MLAAKAALFVPMPRTWGSEMAGSMQEYDDIQNAYIAELDAAMSMLTDWWDRAGENSDIERKTGLPRNRRWPTGKAGHPRVIAIFRKYFLQVDELNDWNQIAFDAFDSTATEDDLWSGSVDEAVLFHRNPRDLLIFDLRDIRHDLFEIMQGMVFVPVGLNHNKDRV